MASFQFKYAAAIQRCSLPNCPPSNLTTHSETAYRWIFSDLSHNNNYLPPAAINPSRKFKDAKEHCDHYALSFFTSQNHAQSRYQSLIGPRPNLRKQLGDALAIVTLTPQDGLRSRISQAGHFNLFEDTSCNLTGRLTWICNL